MLTLRRLFDVLLLVCRAATKVAPASTAEQDTFWPKAVRAGWYEQAICCDCKFREIMPLIVLLSRPWYRMCLSKRRPMVRSHLYSSHQGRNASDSALQMCYTHLEHRDALCSVLRSGRKVHIDLTPRRSRNTRRHWPRFFRLADGLLMKIRPRRPPVVAHTAFLAHRSDLCARPNHLTRAAVHSSAWRAVQTAGSACHHACQHDTIAAGTIACIGPSVQAGGVASRTTIYQSSDMGTGGQAGSSTASSRRRHHIIALLVGIAYLGGGVA